MRILDQVAEFIDPAKRAEAKLRRHINSVCIGWSSISHWNAFKRILLDHPGIHDICILGVYHGRDVAYITTLMQRLGRSYRLTGVDKFEDVPAEDWREKDLGKSWNDLGVTPPDLGSAQRNLQRLKLDAHVELVQGRAQDFLKHTEKTFDFIYIDVSHDYQSTIDCIQLARQRLKPNGVIGGDDFTNRGTWGVARAVRELCPKFHLHDRWIWWEG